MIVDCAIIGGGPAGMNAALVLGRARRKVILFDDSFPHTQNIIQLESGYCGLHQRQAGLE